MPSIMKTIFKRAILALTLTFLCFAGCQKVTDSSLNASAKTSAPNAPFDTIKFKPVLPKDVKLLNQAS